MRPANDLPAVSQALVVTPESAPELAAAVRQAHETARLSTDDLVYELMGEPELLRELTTQMGRLRFAVEGGDRDARDDAETRIRSIGRRMPGNRKVDALCDAALGTGVSAARLGHRWRTRRSSST